MRSKDLASNLYVNRPVLNGEDIMKWAKEQGLTSMLPLDDLHVTLCYSREPLIWDDVPDCPDVDLVVEGEDDDPECFRALEFFGKDENILVLQIESEDLHARWQEFCDCGASYDFAEYKPHVTITYRTKGIDRDKIEPYRGPIVFGCEIFKALDENFQPTKEIDLTAEALPESLTEAVAYRDHEFAIIKNPTKSQLETMFDRLAHREGLRGFYDGDFYVWDAWHATHERARSLLSNIGGVNFIIVGGRVDIETSPLDFSQEVADAGQYSADDFRFFRQYVGQVDRLLDALGEHRFFSKLDYFFDSPGDYEAASKLLTESVNLFESSESRGFWVTPDGERLNCDHEDDLHHPEIAHREFGLGGMQVAFEMGWVRVTYFPKYSILVEYQNDTITPRAKRALLKGLKEIDLSSVVNFEVATFDELHQYDYETAFAAAVARIPTTEHEEVHEGVVEERAVLTENTEVVASEETPSILDADGTVVWVNPSLERLEDLGDRFSGVVEDEVYVWLESASTPSSIVSALDLDPSAVAASFNLSRTEFGEESTEDGNVRIRVGSFVFIAENPRAVTHPHIVTDWMSSNLTESAVPPRKFWLVLDISDRHPERMKDLAERHLKSVKGVSASREIITDWLNIGRNAFLVMDGEAVLRENPGMRPIGYDDPEELLLDNMKALHRLFDDQSDLSVRGKLRTYMLREIDDVRLRADMDWHGFNVDDAPIENLDDLAHAVLRWTGQSDEHFATARRAVEAGMRRLGSTYASEAEWMTNGEFIVPEGSQLTVSINPETVKRHAEWKSNPEALDFIATSHDHDGHEELISTIEKYGLEDVYRVRYLDGVKFQNMRPVVMSRRREMREAATPLHGLLVGLEPEDSGSEALDDGVVCFEGFYPERWKGHERRGELSTLTEAIVQHWLSEYPDHKVAEQGWTRGSTRGSETTFWMKLVK